MFSTRTCSSIREAYHGLQSRVNATPHNRNKTHIFFNMPIQIISLKCKISLAWTIVNTRAIYSGYTTSSILISAIYVRVYSSLNISNVNLIVIFAFRLATRTKKTIWCSMLQGTCSFSQYLSTYGSKYLRRHIS